MRQRDRITDVKLEEEVDLINRNTNSPRGTYSKDREGTFKSNIGNYHIRYSPKGVMFCRVIDNGGGIEDVFGAGFLQKRDMFNRLKAYRYAIESKRTPDLNT